MKVRDLSSKQFFKFVGKDTIYRSNGNGWYDLLGGGCGGPWCEDYDNQQDIEVLTDTTKIIRKDLYCVQSDENREGWCSVFMTRDSRKAFERKREIENNMTLGLMRLSRVVHPSQFMVECWELGGKQIQ